MTRSYRTPILIGIFTALCTAGALYAFYINRSTALIPREVLFGTPEKSDPKISPEGSLVAYLAPYEKVLNVWIYDRREKTAHVLTREKGSGISFYTWAPDGAAILFRQDSEGDTSGHLQKIDLFGEAVKDLTPFKGIQARVLSAEGPFSNQILIELNKEDAARFDVYRLDLRTDALDLVARKTGKIADWVLDAEMKVRGAVAARANGGSGVILRENERSSWKKLFAWDLEDSMSGSVLGFSKNGRKLFLLDPRGTDTARLTTLDLRSGVETTVFSDSNYDVGEAGMNFQDYGPEMVSVVRERQVWIPLRDSARRDLKALQKTHRGDFSIVSRNRDDRLWIVVFNEDRSPLVYFIYDRNTKKAERLFTTRPALLKYRLARMKPVTFAARDGLKLHAYLTLPLGKKKPLPMVLLVHGGPWIRDRWRFDPQVQWLANRGYACLQVNFRGSTGFGKKFVSAGNKEWGRKMQDDLTDAVAWAVQKKIADPQRVGIMGASYGGYAALAGAAFTPGLFKCAVDQFGPSDLAALIRSMPAFWADEKITALKRVGDPGTEADLLKERSPFYHADKIQIPVLIAQGAHDAQTPRTESDRMVEALRQRKIECEYWVFPDEGHGFLKTENRIKFFRAAEIFLARHLGGRSES
jgi:dipeptidyl aminopeptidase/acylaminoacyl peptidase